MKQSPIKVAIKCNKKRKIVTGHEEKTHQGTLIDHMVYLNLLSTKLIKKIQ